jgi:hypothetical protein
VRNAILSRQGGGTTHAAGDAIPRLRSPAFAWIRHRGPRDGRVRFPCKGAPRAAIVSLVWSRRNTD